MEDTTPQAPAEVQDTPTVDAPEASDLGAPAVEDGTRADESVDWEKRYNDLRPKFDHYAQRLSQAEQATAWVEALSNPETSKQAFAALAEQLGYELEDFEDDLVPDDDPFEDDDPQAVDPRLEELWNEREQQKYDAELDALEESMNNRIDALAKDKKLDLTERERELIFTYAISIPPRQDGQPDIDSAFGHVAGLRDEVIKSYRDTKRDAPSPPAPGGASGEPQVPLGDEKARRAAALAVANRAFDSP